MFLFLGRPESVECRRIKTSIFQNAFTLTLLLYAYTDFFPLSTTRTPPTRRNAARRRKNSILSFAHERQWFAPQVQPYVNFNEISPRSEILFISSESRIDIVDRVCLSNILSAHSLHIVVSRVLISFPCNFKTGYLIVGR